jgi:hypothetical protein
MNLWIALGVNVNRLCIDIEYVIFGRLLLHYYNEGLA